MHVLDRCITFLTNAAEEFVMLTNSGESTCDPACVNGSCIDPGLCACHQGWTGLDCSLGKQCRVHNCVCISSLQTNKDCGALTFCDGK